MYSISSTLFIAFISVVIISKTTNAELNEDTYETEIESERVPREIRVTFPGSDRIPKPPTALCFRQPCNVPGGFRPPTGGFGPSSGGFRHRRSEPIEIEDEYEMEIESERVPRDIRVTFPGSDRIPKPPTALCFRQPCNVPGGFNPPRGGFGTSNGGFRHKRSIPTEFVEEIYAPEIESERVPREVRVTFPGSDRIPKPPTALCFRQPCNVPGGFRPPKGNSRFRRSEPVEIEEERVRRSPGFDDKGFRDFTPHSNTRGSIYSTKSFGPQSHGGFVSTAKIEHDFWKSNDGNTRIYGNAQHQRVDGGRFDGFKDNKVGIGLERRFRRSPGFDDKGFRDFTPHSNTRGSIYSTKSFGPQSHGGLVSTAKIEHDFWKSNDGNTRLYGNAQHQRVDGGRFDGFKDNKVGIGLERRFRRSPGFDDKGFRDFTPHSNTRGSIHSTKSFGPQSHGGLVSTAKIEHDFWKSKDGNTRIYGNAQHQRVDGGKYDGFKDSKAGLGVEHKF